MKKEENKQGGKKLIAVKLTDIARKIAGMLPLAVSVLVPGALISALAVFVMLNATEFHAKYIRYVATNSVVMTRVKSREGSYSGTGFHVKAPSGDTYILTNRHICKSSDDGLVEVYFSGSIVPHYQHILAQALGTDLCLLEAVPGAPALKLASGLTMGNEILTLGHPLALPLVVNRGEMIGLGEISTIEEINGKESFDKCRFPNEKVAKLSMFGVVLEQFCVAKFRSIATNATVLPGNSGSPMMDIYGNVVGIIFATSAEDANWGQAVPLDDIKTFLAPY